MLNDLSKIIQRAPRTERGLKLLLPIIRSGRLCGKQGLDSQRQDLALEAHQWTVKLVSPPVQWEHEACPRRRGGGFPIMCPHQDPQSRASDQDPWLLNLPSASSAASQTGGEAWELTSTGLGAAHPATQLSASQILRRWGAVRCRRSRVTELGSRGQRGAGPSEAGSQAGSSAQARESLGPEGPAHLRAPAGEGDGGDSDSSGSLSARSTYSLSQLSARTPRAQPMGEHLAKFPPSRSLPAL